MEDNKMTVPFIVHEGALARLERQLKRLWIALIIAILLLFVTNAMWLYEIFQYDYVDDTQSVVVDSQDSGIANYIGNDGEIYNGESDSN